jgi:hypothetical protein
MVQLFSLPQIKDRKYFVRIHYQVAFIIFLTRLTNLRPKVLNPYTDVGGIVDNFNTLAADCFT